MAISNAQVGNALQASIAQSAVGANINSEWADQLLQARHSLTYLDGGSNLNPLSEFVTHTEDQFGGFMQLFGIDLPTAHFAHSPSRVRDINPAIKSTPSVVSEIIQKERSAMYLFTVDESEVTKISTGETELAEFINANTSRLYDGNSYDEYLTLKSIMLEAAGSGAWTKQYIDQTNQISAIADAIYLSRDKFLMPSPDYNPYGLVLATESVGMIRLVTTPEMKLAINKYLANTYHKDLVDLNVQTLLFTTLDNVWIYNADHTVTTADFNPATDGKPFVDPVVWAPNDVIPAGSYAKPNAPGAVQVIADADRLLAVLCDSRAFGLRDRRPARLYTEPLNRGLVTNIYLHVRQWAYATGLVNAIAFFQSQDTSTAPTNTTLTVVDGTDGRVYSGDTSAYTVGEIIMINGVAYQVTVVSASGGTDGMAVQSL